MIKPNYDKEGNAIYDLNFKKRVQVKKFKGMTMVDIRETYEKNGETLYT